MDPERHTCTWKNASVTLTVTEFLILQALASRPGVVKSRNALMDAAMTKTSTWTTEPSKTVTLSGCGESSRYTTSSSIWSRRFTASAIVSRKHERPQSGCCFSEPGDALPNGLPAKGIGRAKYRHHGAALRHQSWATKCRFPPWCVEETDAGLTTEEAETAVEKAKLLNRIQCLGTRVCCPN